MAKYVNVESGDYTLKIDNGGNIILDTGIPSLPGKVIVTGDLEIQGATTTVYSNDLVIDDNIIQLNRPSTDDGELPVLTPEEILSGIEVNRGAGVDPARWVYDGSISFTDPQTDSVVGGAWVPRVEGGNLLGIQAVSISTPDAVNLNLIGTVADGPGSSKPNTGMVTVKGATGYADRIGNLQLAIVDSGLLPNPTPDEVEKLDYIPNVEWVLEQIAFTLTQTRQPRIEEGTFAGTETYVETQDDTVSGTSQVLIAIDGNITSTFQDTNTRLFDVTIEGNTIRSTEQDQDLVLVGDRYGSVKVDDSLILTPTSQHLNGLLGPGDAVIDPDAPVAAGGVKIYAKPEEPGGTGIFFVNEGFTRDELISKNKAILYSMIF
jgi:hypothetical protein